MTDLHNARLMLVLLLLGGICAIGLFDLWAWVAHGRHATASALITDWSREWKIIALLVGLLIGHLFNDRERTAVLLLGVGLGVLFW